jgi:uncharacterized repeat protein (TIGR01451 family)
VTAQDSVNVVHIYCKGIIMQRKHLVFAALPMIGAALVTSVLVAQARVFAQEGDYNEVFSSAQEPYLFARVNQTHNWVNGEATPGTVLTVTLRRAGMALDTQSFDVGGEFSAGFSGPTRIQAGDVVELQSSTGLTASIDVIAMSGVVDPLANTISGHIAAPGCPANVRGEVWRYTNGTSQEAVSDAACNYTVNFSPSDVLPGDNIAVWYVRPDGNEVGIVRSALRVMVDLDDSRVSGSTSPQATVYVTVTGSPQKAAEATVADVNGDFNFPLYSANIDAGDTVSVSSGGKTYAVSIPMTLTASMDAATDTISGYGPPNTTLFIEVTDRPVKGASVMTDGTGFFSLNTNTSPWEYDLQPNDMGNLYLFDANGQQVYVNFGAVNLATYINANGQAAPGGRFVYELHYQAHKAAVKHAVLTDTLPAGASFVGVSGGYTYTLIGNQVVIEAGMVHQDQDCYVLLTVAFSDAASPGDQVTNQVTVGADAYNQHAETGNDTATHVMELVASNADLNVWQDPRTGDPAAGQKMIWQIGYHNNGNTGSGPVRITDTLPVSTTYVDWWSDEAGWTLVQTGTQVVLQRDAIGGNQGSWLYLVVQLDPALAAKQQLINTVDSFVPNDVDVTNNASSRDVYVSPARQNLSVAKHFDSGSQVPGGMIYFGIDYKNDGNVAVQPVWLTDTLPAGMTFIKAGYGTQQGWVNVPYSNNVGNQYIWNLGPQVPGANGNFEVVVQVQPSVVPGVLITNSVRIGGGSAEAWPSDDVATAGVTIYPHGPNLRVYKESNWNGAEQLEYTLHVENIGDVSINNVRLTDVYPVHTSFANWWMQWCPGEMSWSEEVSAQRSVFTLTQVDAGNTAGLKLQLNVDGPYVDQPGLLFTNTLSATLLQSDVNPADNVFAQTAFAGADLYATHTATGTLGAGKVITYQLEFGNRSTQWETQGDTTWVIFQLPDDMSSLSVSPTPDLHPSANIFIWQYGRLGPYWQNGVQLTAQIPTTPSLGEWFTSTLTINNTNPTGVEAYTDNNTSSVTLKLPVRKVYIPTVICSQ